jgi:hypothetical protein
MPYQSFSCLFGHVTINEVEVQFSDTCKCSLVLVLHLQRQPSTGNAVLLPISFHEGDEHDETNGSGTDTEVETEEE